MRMFQLNKETHFTPACAVTPCSSDRLVIASILISVWEIVPNMATTIISELLYIIILYFLKTNKETQLSLFAVAVALGILGIIAVESISIPQQQQAHAAVGCVNGTVFILFTNCTKDDRFVEDNYILRLSHSHMWYFYHQVKS